MTCRNESKLHKLGSDGIAERLSAFESAFFSQFAVAVKMRELLEKLKDLRHLLSETENRKNS